jgi:hypothetical protein
VHKNLTGALANAVYGIIVGSYIADWDQNVDDNPETAPQKLSPVSARKEQINNLWHFPSQERIEELHTAFINDPSVETAGKFLHVYQDSFSHAGYTGKYGHGLSGLNPLAVDHTWESPEKADAMAKGTYDMLISMKNYIDPEIFPHIVPWDVIKPYVQQFNRADNETKKNEAINSMHYAINKYREEQNWK